MHKKSRGIALVGVLWLLVLLTAVTVALTATVRGEIRAVGNTLQMTRAAYAAEGAVELGILNLLTPQAQRWPADGSIFEMEFEGLQLRIAMQDEAGKIDLNSADFPLLNSLLVRSGVEPDRAAHIADAIVDWRDSDDLRRLNGAEQSDYRMAGRDYAVANAGFHSVDELQLVLGMDSEIYTTIRPALTVHSGLSGVNPSFAAPQVAAAIDGLANAQTKASGLSYTIYAEARAADGIVSKLAVTVALAPDGTGKPYQVLAWNPAPGDIFAAPAEAP
jgi:general secretion pathway protein K